MYTLSCKIDWTCVWVCVLLIAVRMVMTSATQDVGVPGAYTARQAILERLGGEKP